MNLMRTSLWSGLAVLTRLATTLLLNKVLAVYVGPAGYGVIGQLQSVITLSTAVASGSVNTGVVKYTAEHAADLPYQRRLWSTAARLGLACVVPPVAVFLVGHDTLARWLLGGDDHAVVFIWLAAALPLLVLNGLLLAILNGRREVRALVVANMGGSVIGAVLAAGLVIAAGLSGALVALAVSQAVACGWTAWLARKTLRLVWADLSGSFDRGIARALGAFALMAVTSAVMAPLAQMLIRDHLASTQGWAVTGLWQALWKISETHLLLLTSTLSVYFLPRFAEIRDGRELRSEVWRGYRFVVPVVLLSASALYLFRDTLVRTLLTPAFLPLVDALALQLLGDVLKIVSWVMSYTMLSHARTRAFIATEVAFSGLLVGLTVALTPRFGLQGTAAAYALTYAAYGVVVYAVFSRLTASMVPDSPARGAVAASGEVTP